MSALPFEDLTVVVTGEVEGLDRDQAKEAVLALGGKPMGSVSGKTGLVVAGVGAGVSKMQKVKQFGTPVITGEQFLAVIADPASWTGLPDPADVAEAAQVPVVEPYVAPAHQVIQCTVYPDGVREVRLRCSCGKRWLGEGLHDREKGCPQDPDGYPRDSWTPPPTVGAR